MSTEVHQATGKAHPFADLFPLLEPHALRELADDIAANGQRTAILLYGGLILDGRNRWAACRLAGIEPRTEEFQGTAFEALKYVCSLNLHRRHLTDSQRAMIGAEIAKLPQGRPETGHMAGFPVATQTQAADLMHVSERQIRRARVVADKGSPELVAKVKSGELKVGAAERQLRTMKRQRDAVALPVSPEAPPAPADQRSWIAQFDALWRETLQVGRINEFVLHIEKLIAEWRTRS